MHTDTGLPRKDRIVRTMDGAFHMAVSKGDGFVAGTIRFRFDVALLDVADGW